MESGRDVLGGGDDRVDVLGVKVCVEWVWL
ncbi:hypothetical protein BWD121_012960 [Bartonella sp. WD12.1]|nr:hypothetical protein BWD121_012960 [Bartonella sp. WD12.1]